METVNTKFYDGFEGEPEIHFIYQGQELIEKVIVWEGYFDEIMMTIKPVDGRWTSLAYNYHLDIGWYEESPWKVKELREALAQFGTVDKEMIGTEAKQMLEEICNLFEKAIGKRGEILIEY